MGKLGKKSEDTFSKTAVLQVLLTKGNSRRFPYVFDHSLVKPQWSRRRNISNFTFSTARIPRDWNVKQIISHLRHMMMANIFSYHNHPCKSNHSSGATIERWVRLFMVIMVIIIRLLFQVGCSYSWPRGPPFWPAFPICSPPPIQSVTRFL